MFRGISLQKLEIPLHGRSPYKCGSVEHRANPWNIHNIRVELIQTKTKKTNVIPSCTQHTKFVCRK